MDKLILKLSGALFFIFIGFIARRINILNEERVRRVTEVTTNILFPCLIFNVVYTNFSLHLVKDTILLFSLAITVSIIGYFLGYFFTTFLKLEDRMRPVFLLLSFKPASGLIGVPLCIIFFGEESLLFSGPYAFGIGLIFYTLGLGLLRQENFSWKALVNPVSASIALAILLALFKAGVPEIVLQPLKFFGIFAVPLALVIVGAIFAMVNFKKGIIDKRVFFVAFNKLVFAPLLVFLFCLFLPLGPLEKKVALLMAAIPSSVTMSMWALRFDADYVWASSAALFVGISSIITIGLLSWVLF